MSANVCDSMVQWPVGSWLTCACTTKRHSIHRANVSDGRGGTVCVRWKDDGTILSPKTWEGGR